MVYTVGWLAALRDESPDETVARVVQQLTAPDVGARLTRQSSGERWVSGSFDAPDGGSPVLEVHQYDPTVDLMIRAAEEADVDVSFLPDSFIEWYPNTSEIGLVEVVFMAAVARRPYVMWDSVDGYDVGAAR